VHRHIVQHRTARPAIEVKRQARRAEAFDAALPREA
jgi:hypothetical protein